MHHLTASFHAHATVTVSLKLSVLKIIKMNLNTGETTKRFPLNPDGSFKENHSYYFQIQLQMFIYNLSNGHFLIFCKQKPNESILFSVTRDNNLLKIMLEKFEQYFHKIILPEIVTRKYDISNENDRKAYCFCRRTSFGKLYHPNLQIKT